MIWSVIVRATSPQSLYYPCWSTLLYYIFSQIYTFSKVEQMFTSVLSSKPATLVPAGQTHGFGVEGTLWLRVTHQRQNIKVKHSIKATVHQGAQSGPNPCRDLPEMMVTGPHMSPSFCRAKFLIRHRIRVLLPTLGGPTTTITIGGGSRGVRSTRGIWCFFIFMSWDLQEKKVHGKSIWAVRKLTTSPVIPTFD